VHPSYRYHLPLGRSLAASHRRSQT
jgi:hypothetical protein